MMLRSRLFWQFFLSIMAVVLLTAVISVRFEGYVRDNASPKRINRTVNTLVAFRDELAFYLSDEDIEGARELLLDNPDNQRQFLVFDEYDNEILDRDNVLNRRFRRHFEHPLNDEFKSRGLALQTEVDSYLGQTYFINILPKMDFNPWLSPRLAGTLLRTVLLVLLTAVVCYWLTRTLTRRIRQLQQATQRFANRDFNSDALQLPLGNDELGQLGKDFQRMANQLSESERARKQMLSDISHELRSPLARQQVAIEIARTRQGKGEDLEPQLDRMEIESERMNALIGQIIHIQKLTLDTTQHELNKVSLYELLADIIDDVNFEYQNEKKRAELLATEEDWQIEGEADLLRSAFENIIRNAMSHTHEDTVVSVSLAKDVLNDVHLVISDAGDGVEAAQLETIFQPFTRLDSSRNRETGGYGLGLAIAKAVIERHHGNIVAENKQGASGLSVMVTLPAR